MPKREVLPPLPRRPLHWVSRSSFPLGLCSVLSQPFWRVESHRSNANSASCLTCSLIYSHIANKPTFNWRKLPVLFYGPHTHTQRTLGAKFENRHAELCCSLRLRRHQEAHPAPAVAPVHVVNDGLGGLPPLQSSTFVCTNDKGGKDD